jgi:phage-related holin
MKGLYDTVSKMFAVMGVFVSDCIADIMPWLVVTFSVIICDLITGCRKSMIMGETIRFSRAFRATMGKMVTYFSFVVMMVFIEHASEDTNNLDKWAILFICFIEICSIISNILRPKGYDINVVGAIGLLAKKVFGLDKEDTNGIITKKEEEQK